MTKWMHSEDEVGVYVQGILVQYIFYTRVPFKPVRLVLARSLADQQPQHVPGYFTWQLHPVSHNGCMTTSAQTIDNWAVDLSHPPHVCTLSNLEPNWLSVHLLSSNMVVQDHIRCLHPQSCLCTGFCNDLSLHYLPLSLKRTVPGRHYCRRN